MYARASGVTEDRGGGHDNLRPLFKIFYNIYKILRRRLYFCDGAKICVTSLTRAIVYVKILLILFVQNNIIHTSPDRDGPETPK